MHAEIESRDSYRSLGHSIGPESINVNQKPRTKARNRCADEKGAVVHTRLPRLGSSLDISWTRTQDYTLAGLDRVRAAELCPRGRKSPDVRTIAGHETVMCHSAVAG